MNEISELHKNRQTMRQSCRSLAVQTIQRKLEFSKMCCARQRLPTATQPNVNNKFVYFWIDVRLRCLHLSREANEAFFGKCNAIQFIQLNRLSVQRARMNSWFDGKLDCIGWFSQRNLIEKHRTPPRMFKGLTWFVLFAHISVSQFSLSISKGLLPIISIWSSTFFERTPLNGECHCSNEPRKLSTWISQYSQLQRDFRKIALHSTQANSFESNRTTNNGFTSGTHSPKISIRSRETTNARNIPLNSQTKQ